MNETVEHVPAGKIAPAQVGDFFLVNGSGPIRRMIQLGQGLRFTREEAKWNHAGLFVGETGQIVEALTSDVTAGNISKYLHVEYIVVHVGANGQDQDQMLKFATWALGKEYGFMSDISLALSCLVGGKLSFGIDGQVICSGLVARALERAGYVFDRDPSHVMPADLARVFKVHHER